MGFKSEFANSLSIEDTCSLWKFESQFAECMKHSLGISCEKEVSERKTAGGSRGKELEDKKVKWIKEIIQSRQNVDHWKGSVVDYE